MSSSTNLVWQDFTENFEFLFHLLISPTFWQVFDIKIGELFCTFTKFTHTITSRFESSNKNLFIGQHHTIDLRKCSQLQNKDNNLIFYLFNGTSGSLIGFEMNKTVSFGSVTIWNKGLDCLFEFRGETTSITFIDDFAGQNVSERRKCIVQHFIRDLTHWTPSNGAFEMISGVITILCCQ